MSETIKKTTSETKCNTPIAKLAKEWVQLYGRNEAIKMAERPINSGSQKNIGYFIRLRDMLTNDIGFQDHVSDYYALEVLGKEQYISNKEAAAAIKSDFEAGFELAKAFFVGTGNSNKSTKEDSNAV